MTDTPDLETKILHFLVETLGGHQVRIIRKGVGSMMGFSVSNRHTLAIRDLLDVVAENSPDSALSTDAEPVKTPFEVASKRIPEARVSLLSRAIRQGLKDYGWKNFGTLPEVLMGYIVEAERAEAATHGEPVKTAPAVAVKALEWNPFRADTPFGYYHIDDQTDRSPDELKGRPPFLLSGSRLDLTRHPTLEAARAAAQADYEARILSALSSQVQDVAGELSRINEMMDGGDDEGSPILPEFKDGWSVEAKVEACLHLLEKRRDVIEGFTAKENWRDDPAQDERWNAGLDFAMLQLCKVLKVDPQSINWDCATETLEGDAQSQIHKVLAATSPAAKQGEAE